jgi:hypothetical protein
VSLDIAAAARDRILADLRRVERSEGVRILFAVESGSRAWGFPSPDSDHDVRFVYVGDLDRYLRLDMGRDVVELPIDGLFDVNGWDLRKALTLLLKPNPVVLEWLSSPIRYRWDDDLCGRLRAIGTRASFASACVRHYASLARKLHAKHVVGRDAVNLKKYLYVVRPALCLAWLRTRPEVPPPMNLQALAAGVTLAPEFDEALQALVARKLRASELGMGPPIAAIDAFVAE